MKSACVGVLSIREYHNFTRHYSLKTGDVQSYFQTRLQYEYTYTRVCCLFSASMCV